MPFHPFATRPVLDTAPAMLKKQGFRDCPIDHNAPAYDTPCEDLSRLGISGRNHYAHADNPPYYMSVPGAIDALYLRRPVAQKLIKINQDLKPFGLGLYVFDAWRPDAVQRYFHTQWFPDWLRKHRPSLSESALTEEVNRYWSAPTDCADSPAPHLTGGAVDLSLHYLSTGQCVFAGSLFDELSSVAQTDYFERKTCTTMSDMTARTYRRILYWSLIEAGFANNPTEWWHYSWGDQMWARLTGKKTALLGSCDPCIKSAKRAV